MVKELRRAGRRVVVLDDLSTGHRDAVDVDVEFIHASLLSREMIEQALRRHSIGAVIHFAAKCYVGESVADPAKYYLNNVVGTVNLLDAMRATGVRELVFSSSCSTYGHPTAELIDESHPQSPVNPYGSTKLACEVAMRQYAAAYGLRTVALRYFNAAGCDVEGELGERHDPETHLIPLVLLEARRVMNGGDPALSALTVFGTDFDTLDGSCIRDYVHVQDLCSAHLNALEKSGSMPEGSFLGINLGTGSGTSVLQIIDACGRVTGQQISYRVGPRRPGDPSRLVADCRLAQRELSWTASIPDIGDIVSTAWRWFSRSWSEADAVEART
jgi:UDP-glucose 4-epimerase